MQVSGTAPRLQLPISTRKLTYFLAAPLTAVVLISILLALVVTAYQQRHEGRVFTGVSVWGVDLGGMNAGQALRALRDAFSYPDEGTIVLVDPKDDRRWEYPPAELGVTLDDEATLAAAFAVGRQGNPISRLVDQFRSWYFGRSLAPIVIFDEAKLDQTIALVASDINRPAADASLGFTGIDVSYDLAQVGHFLDVPDTRSRLAAAVSGLHVAQIQLLIHQTRPRVDDTSEAARQIQNVLSGPMTLFLQEPLAGSDLEPISIPVDELVKWIRVHTVENDQGQAETQVIIDENAVRAWLAPYEATLRRDPVNARFYFDDNTRELVLVEPHVNGRALDMDTTVKQFVQQVLTPNRSMPFVMSDIVPTVHAGAMTTDLGITELVSESTTWFYGSSDERMHNIARAASNFYGIVIAPGEEFSFNRYLGEVSAEQGYEQGLIIFGGRTIEGVGGGVCQVSTTAFQAAFWAGFPITERWQHGYQVGYYDDGEGPGMDATVYAPLVDLRFINDTPYHLLIENYYSEANSSLTFKFYSTSMGRTVVKEGPVIENIVPAKPDIWEFNDELEEGEIEQVDWAVDGADVTVEREVFNADGVLIRQDTFKSYYVPWQNIYQYGPNAQGVPGVSAPEEPPPSDEQQSPDEGEPANQDAPAEETNGL